MMENNTEQNAKHIQQLIKDNRSSNGLSHISKGLLVLSEVIGTLAERLDSWPPHQLVETITYEDAITYLVENRPPTAKQAVIMRERRYFGRGIVLTQMYLDKQDEPIHNANHELVGRRLVVEQLDDELKETFGNMNIVIVK